MIVAPLPWKVMSWPSMAGSLAATVRGLLGALGLAAAAPEAAGLAAAEPDAGGGAAGEPEAAGLAEAGAAGLAEAAALAGAAGELAGAAVDGLAAAELAGAASPPQPSNDRMEAAEATPPAMYITRRIISRR